MDNKKIISIVILFVFSVFLLLSVISPAMAAGELPGLKKTGEAIGYHDSKTSSTGKYIGKIIQSVLAFIGIIFMIIILMGAFDIQGAGGNEETVKKGKDKIKNGAIGLAIVFSAYIVSYIFLNWLAGADLKIFIVN